MFDKTRLPYVVLDVICVVLGTSRPPPEGKDGSGAGGRAGGGAMRARGAAMPRMLPSLRLLRFAPTVAFGNAGCCGNFAQKTPGDAGSSVMAYMCVCVYT